MSSYAVSQRQVVSFYYQLTGTYETQYRRGFDFNLNGELVNRLETAIERNNGKLLPENFVSPTSQFLSPSNTTENPVDIVNGWDTPRLRFWLKICVTDQFGGKKFYNYQGYSEFADLSFGGNIDPNLRFFINNTGQANVSQQERVGNNGFAILDERVTVAGSRQILHDNGYQKRGGIAGEGKNYGLTPENVFSNMNNLEMVEVMEDNMNTMLYDTSTYVTQAPTRVDRAHLLMPIYSADILNTYVGTRQSVDQYRNDDDDGSFYSACAERCRNLLDDSQNDVFMEFLQRRNNQHMGFSAGGLGNSFTFNDLRAFDPGADQVTRPIDGQLDGQRGTSANWNGTDHVAVCASTLAYSVPSLMSRFGLSVVSFSATNMATHQRDHVVKFEGLFGLVSNNVGLAERMGFESMLINTVLTQLSFGHGMGYSFSVTCDMSGETILTILIEGDREHVFVAPTFCDALYSPLVTSHQNLLNTASYGFNELGLALTSVVNSANNISVGASGWSSPPTSSFNAPQSTGWGTSPLKI